MHLLEVDLELFGNQHRDRRVGALPHLDIRHHKGDPPVAIDADESVRRKLVALARFGVDPGARQAQAQDEAAADGRAGSEECASGKSRRRLRGAGRRDAIEDHGRPPCPLEACLMAARMRG